MIRAWRRLAAEALDRRFGPLNGRLDALESALAELAERIEQRGAGQDARLEQLATELAATGEAAGAARQGAEALAPVLWTLAAGRRRSRPPAPPARAARRRELRGGLGGARPARDDLDPHP